MRINVQIPLGGPDKISSETRVFRHSPLGPRVSPKQVRGLCRVGSCPCSGIWHGTDQTLSLVGSGRVVSKFHCTNPTRHVRACDQVSDKVCSPCRIHYTDPRTLSAIRPDQTHGQSPYMSRLSGQVYDQIKSADLSETQAVRGSGLVGSV